MSDKRKPIIQLGLLLAAGSFIVYGAFRGEVQVLFTKAVNICLECIGLG